MDTRVWAEVSLETIAANFRFLQAQYGDVAAVLKANAYGHGLVPVARACVAAGAQRLCVATLAEGQALRRMGISARIYVLSALLPEEAEACLRSDLVPFVSSVAFFDALAQVAQHAPLPAECFLVLDTGMGREGLDQASFCRLLAMGSDNVRIVGVSTHLASADEVEDRTMEEQATTLARWVSGWEGERTITNSPGMLRGIEQGFHRAGAILYGIEPYAGALESSPIRPALALKARLTLVKPLPVGATIGYGRTHTLGRDSVIATVPAGYGDGWLRRLGNRGFVVVRGQRCPIVGRVSMDQSQIDVTDVPGAQIGDVATLIGAGVTAREVAEWAETTAHEPTTLLSGRVPRYYDESL